MSKTRFIKIFFTVLVFLFVSFVFVDIAFACQGNADCPHPDYYCWFDDDGTGYCVRNCYPNCNGDDNDNGNDNGNGNGNGNDDPSCTPSSSCDASCPSGAECGSASGTETTVYEDCSTSTSSCTISCGSCASTNYYCDGDNIRREGETCSSYTCESFDNHVEDCTDHDRWYCSDGAGPEPRRTYDINGLYESGEYYSHREYRYHTCSGADCVIDSVGSVEDCTASNGWYCAESGDLESQHIGDGLEYMNVERNYYCSGGSCNNYIVTSYEDCGDYDGWYCNVDNEEECVYREHQCSGGEKDAPYSENGNCTYNITASSNCPDLDGYYCQVDDSIEEDIREERVFDCSGGSCSQVGITDSYSCADYHDDWSFSEYGDRTLCSGDTSPPIICTHDPPSDPEPESECQSYPIAYNFSWNYIDHNYSYSEHGRADYPYCKSLTPVSIEINWNYWSQTDHDHAESHIQVSEGNYNFSNSLVVDRTLNDTNYTIDGARLEFDQDYYMRVKVTDTRGRESGWFYME